MNEKTPFRKIVIILAKLPLCEMSSNSVNKMRGAQILRNITTFGRNGRTFTHIKEPLRWANQA